MKRDGVPKAPLGNFCLPAGNNKLFCYTGGASSIPPWPAPHPPTSTYHPPSYPAPPPHRPPPSQPARPLTGKKENEKRLKSCIIYLRV